MKPAWRRGIALHAAWVVGMGALVADPVAALCTASETTMCLRQDRFRVEVSWRNFQGQSGQGKVVDAGDDARAWIGRSVVVPAVIPCGACPACRAPAHASAWPAPAARGLT